MALQGPTLGPKENRKTVQNRTFEDRLAPGPSKNGLWNGALKKHEKTMRTSCKNHPKTMPKVIRKSIKFKAFLKKLKLSKCFVLQHFFMFFQMKALRKSMQKLWKIDAKRMPTKYRKINAKRMPTIMFFEPKTDLRGTFFDQFTLSGIVSRGGDHQGLAKEETEVCSGVIIIIIINSMCCFFIYSRNGQRPRVLF